MMNRSLLHLPAAMISCLIFWQCSRGPYAEANRSYKKQAREYGSIIRQAPLRDSFETRWVGTTNFNLRKPNMVVLHHTAQNSCEQTLNTFTTTRTQVSSHYVICRNGVIYHILNDYLRGWHAGAGSWGGNSDINSTSVGIELDNNGMEPFPEEQIQSLLQLLGNLKRAFNIPAANFIGHADMAPTRKNDPSIHFPWKQLADNGYGLWWDDTTGLMVPEHFEPLTALRIIGYDIRDAGAAIRAFKRKYIGNESVELEVSDRKVLYALYRKYL